MAVAWLEEHGGETCILRFCSDGLAGGTGRWDVYMKVLWRWLGERNMEVRRVF